MTDYDLDSLGHREFEHLIQSLAIKIIAAGITPFGDGPDGGREATYEGKMNYPSEGEPWQGYLIIQCKHRMRNTLSSNVSTGSWALNQIEKELKKFSDKKRDLRSPEFYIFATNVSLSATYKSGAKDRLNSTLNKYARRLKIKAFDIWSYDEICRFLDANMDIRSHYAHFLSSGDLLTDVRSGLDILKISQEDIYQTLKKLGKERRDLQSRLDKFICSSMRFATSFSGMSDYKPEDDKRIHELTDNVRSYINEINNIMGEDHPDIVLSNATLCSVNMEYQSVLEMIPSQLSESLFENARRSVSRAIEAYRLRASAYFKLRRWPEAIAEYKKILELDKNADYATRSLGVALLEIGEIENAKCLFETEKKHLENVVYNNPNLDDVLNLVSNYGYCALTSRHSGDFNAVISNSKKAISLLENINDVIPTEEYNSHMGHIYNNMGLVYTENRQASIALSHLKKSISYFEKSIEIDTVKNPDDHNMLAYAVSLSNCADSYLTLGENKKAIDCYNLSESKFKLLVNKENIGGSIDELANIFTNRSNSYLENDRRKAIKDLNSALRIRQDLVNKGYVDREGYLSITLLNRGKQLLKLKKYKYSLRDLNRAISIFEKTINKNTKIKFLIFYIHALIERAIVRIDLKEYDSALNDLNAAIGLYLKNKDSQMLNLIKAESARAFYMRGNAKEILNYEEYDIIQDFTNSINILQNLTEDNIDDHQIYTLFCNCLIRRGHLNEHRSMKSAIEDYSLSISLGEEFLKNKGNRSEITLSLIRGLFNRHAVNKKIGEYTKARSDLFRSAILSQSLQAQIIQKEETLIAEILASYSSLLLDIGRAQDVYYECKFFLDYLSNKGKKISKISHAKIYNNIGFSFTLKGKPDKAIEMFNLAIEFYTLETKKNKDKSEYLLAGSINNRGNAHYTSGLFDKAIDDYNFSIRIASNIFSKNQTDDNKFLYARSLTSMAWLLSTCPESSYRDGSKALELSEKACEIMNWNDTDCLYTYAAACATNGDYVKACSWQRKAISIASSEPERAYLKMVLRFYENNRPFRAPTV